MTPPAELKSELTKTRLDMAGTSGLDEDFDREMRALETRGIDTSAHFEMKEGESPIGWVDDVWKDPKVAEGIENEIRFIQGEWSKGRNAGEIQKINEFADDISLHFKKIYGAFSGGRSAEGAALLVEVKDKLHTLRRDSWWKTFLTHGETNALQRLIGDQEVQTAQWNKQEALAELENAKLDAEAMRNQAKSRRKNGFLSAIIAVVSIVAIVVTAGAAAAPAMGGAGFHTGAGFVANAMMSGPALTATTAGGLTAMQGFQLGLAGASLGGSISQMV